MGLPGCGLAWARAKPARVTLLFQVKPGLRRRADVAPDLAGTADVSDSTITKPTTTDLPQMEASSTEYFAWGELPARMTATTEIIDADCRPMIEAIVYRASWQRAVGGSCVGTAGQSRSLPGRGVQHDPPVWRC